MAVSGPHCSKSKERDLAEAAGPPKLLLQTTVTDQEIKLRNLGIY